MTKQESLNKAAQEFGYAAWAHVKPIYSLKELESLELKYIIHRAMDIYAGEHAVKFGEFIRRDYTKTMGGGQWLHYGEQKHVSNTTEQLYEKYKNNQPSNKN